MAETIQLEVATPERLIVSAPVTEVQIPAADGMLGILPNHAALLSELGAGSLSYSGPEGRRVVAVNGGWVQVINNFVRVLADRAEAASDIDTARAEAALKRAVDRLAQPSSAGIDIVRALNSRRRAEARLEAVRVYLQLGPSTRH